jgi:hypothetical protein
MVKKCPPGVICIENVTFIILLLVLGYIVYQNLYLPMINSKQEKNTYNSTIIPTLQLPTIIKPTSFVSQVPITVNTQRMETTYRQAGILTRLNQKETILPLHGRMVNTSRVKWQYYTVNDSNNHVRLPISVNGRSGSDEYGVDELSTGDTVYVQGYDDIFKVTIYENNRFTYNAL